MTESQTSCRDCGAVILQHTADGNDGRCVRCHRKAVLAASMTIQERCYRILAALLILGLFCASVLFDDGKTLAGFIESSDGFWFLLKLLAFMALLVLLAVLIAIAIVKMGSAGIELCKEIMKGK